MTVLRYPAFTAAIIIAVTIAAFFGISKLRVDDSLSELFRTDTPEFHDYEVMSERFPSSEYDVLIVITGDKLLDRKSITALRSLLTELQFVDGMTGLVSLFSAREAPEPGKVSGPVFPAKLPKGEDYDKLIEQVRKNEIISGKLLSDDGTLTLVLLALDRKVVSDKGLASVVQQIHDTAETELKDTGLGMKLSGAPVMQLEIRNAVERDRNLYNALGFLFGAIIAYAFFRRLSLMVIAALPPVVAIIWSLGLFGWLGFKLNLFLNVMIPLIMVLGFSDSMQLTVAMRNRLLEGDRRIKAARYAVLVVGPACVLATATAAASFIALFFSDSALIRTFGFAGAMSTVIAFIVGISLVPLLTRTLIGRNTRPLVANLKSQDWAMNALKRFCAWIAEIGVRHPKTVVALGLLIVIAFGAIYTTLPPRYRLADQVPDREQAVAASEQLDAKLTGANPLHVMVDWPRGKTLYDPDVLKVIGDIHAIVEDQSGVGNVWSIETLRRWLAKTGEDKPDKLKEYMGILPDYLTQRFIDEKDNSAVVTGRIPDVDVSDLLPVIEKLDGKLNTVREANPGYRIVVTGLSAIAARNSATMISKLNAGLTTEIVFICIFLTRLPFDHGHLRQHSAESVSSVHRRRHSRRLRRRSAICQHRRADRLLRSFAQRHRALSQPVAARGAAGRGSGHRRRARHRADRAGSGADFADPRLRAWRDGSLRPAVLAAVRQVVGAHADGGVDRRSFDVAGERATYPAHRRALAKGELAHQRLKFRDDHLIDRALERHHKVRQIFELDPAPGIELALIPGLRFKVDLALLALEARREPKLLLPAIAPFPCHADHLAGQIVVQPVARPPNDARGSNSGLFIQLAECRLLFIFARIDAALRHLPPIADTLRRVGGLGAPADKGAAFSI